MNEFTSPEARPTLIERLRARRAARTATPDAGLALLDILLGMALFALIVVIAIQGVSAVRQAAYQTRATSDAQQLSVGMETFFSSAQAYPTTTQMDATNQAATLTSMGVNLSSGDVIVDYSIDTAATDYAYCITHVSGGAVDAYAIYDSALGRIVAQGKGGLPAAAGVAVTGGSAATINCVV